MYLYWLFFSPLLLSYTGKKMENERSPPPQLNGGRRAESEALAEPQDLMLHLGGEENNVAELIINSPHSWRRSELKHGAGLAPVYTVIISVNMAAGLCRCSPFHHAAAAAAAAADGGLQPFLLSQPELALFILRVQAGRRGGE